MEATMNNCEVKLISVTQPVPLMTTAKTPEDIIIHCARVSSPKNQEDLSTGVGLLKFCIKNKHWSVFTMADMTIEVVTSRAISAQVLRHKSFDFQEFSQRYAEVQGFKTYEARRQDKKNRQNSVDDLPDEVRDWFVKAQLDIQAHASVLYNQALEKGIAKESARFVLPMSTETTFYMKGSVRSWIHYCQLRRAHGTQKEHVEVADKAWQLFKQVFPITAEALESQAQM
jgi:thymidylate synthase (FAD)